jgi:hypothetical protein
MIRKTVLDSSGGLMGRYIRDSGRKGNRMGSGT